MFANQTGLMPAHAVNAPPPWAVLLVKGCVVGILTFPVAVPLLLVGSAALGAAESFRRAAFFASWGVWLAMFVLAQYLTTVYPPVPRRR
jgi:ABC-type transport system involved in cytochrome c biogenesis permease component